QLVRQLVAENLLLALLGGAGAVTFSILSARVLERLPFQLPILDSSRLTLDWRVFLFATALSLATTLLFGLRPALQHAWNDVVVALNPGATQSSARYSRIRSNLVMTQVTVSTALLITAGLLVGSTRMNLSTDHGFRADHVLIGSINFTGSGYDADKQRLFYERLLHRLAEERQIISGCIVDSLPIALPAGDYFRFGGFLGRYVVRRDFSDEETQVFTNIVSPGQFDTLRIQLIEGRDFNEADRPNSPKVGIVNSAMARRLWSNESAVGRTVRGEDGALIEIVGVAADIRYQDDERVAPLLYRPLAQHSQVRGYLPNTLLIRTADEPLRVAGAVQGAIAAIDPTLLAYNMHTLEDRLERTLLPLRVFAYIAGVPGVFALLLGLVG